MRMCLLLSPLLTVGLLACPNPPLVDDSCGEAPALPPADDGLMLGAAGSPLDRFGEALAPTFDVAFDELADNGFNAFLPVFLEDEFTSTDHIVHFLPPAEGIEPYSCTGASNPYAAARGKLKILFPAFLLVPVEEWTGEMDADSFAARFADYVDVCLGGDDDLLAAAYNFDEPANNFSATNNDDVEGTFSIANVATLAREVRALSDVPVMLVEAPMPFFLDAIDLPAAQSAPLLEDFFPAVAQTAPTADIYGYDVYPVGLSEDLAVVGEYVRTALADAPGKRVLATLQAASFSDQNIADGPRPTFEQTRFMAFDALVNGASDLAWYGGSTLDLNEGTELWDDVLAVAREIRSLSGMLALPSVDVEVDGPDIIATARQGQGVTWVLLVNESAVEQTASLKAPRPNLRIFDVDGNALGEAASEVKRVLPGYGTEILALQDCELQR